jgi:hypothetical protein
MYDNKILFFTVLSPVVEFNISYNKILLVLVKRYQVAQKSFLMTCIVIYFMSVTMDPRRKWIIIKNHFFYSISKKAKTFDFKSNKR